MVALFFGIIAIVLGLIVLSAILGLVTGLLGWLIIGLLAGMLATAFMKDGRRGLLGNMGLGLLGSLVSGLLLHLSGLGHLDHGLILNLVFSTLGAMLIIAVGRMFSRNRSANYPGINNYNNYNRM